MSLGRTFASWLWLVFGTAVWGSLVFVVAPFDRKGRVWWRFIRAWAAGLSWAMGVTRLEVRGAEHLASACGVLTMMNHTSGVDILALIRSRDRPVAFLAKRGLFLVPFFGSFMRAARMVPIDRRNLQRAVASLDRAGDRVLAGETIHVFPEGTRSQTGKLLPFKKGGFVLSHRRGIPILPMVIAGGRAIHCKGALIRRKGPIVLVVDEPIDPAAFDDYEALMAHTRARMVRCTGRAARLLQSVKEEGQHPKDLGEVG
jgi:1-acyl-sn-glycerol-3-phosphate acyltransferase